MSFVSPVFYSLLLKALENKYTEACDSAKEDMKSLPEVCCLNDVTFCWERFLRPFAQYTACDAARHAGEGIPSVEGEP